MRRPKQKTRCAIHGPGSDAESSYPVGSTLPIEYVRVLSTIHRLGQYITPADSPPTYSIPETNSNQVTIGVIFAPLCTYEPSLTGISLAALTRTSFMLTPLILSNAEAEFRKTSGFSYRGLLDSGLSILTLIQSSDQPVPTPAGDNT